MLKDPRAYRTWTTDTIRYCDLDPNGHVNNGAINAFFEDGRVRFRSERLAELADEILTGFVLVKYTVEYHAMLRFPGTVEIGTAVLKIGNSSYTLAQGLFHHGACVATAEAITVRVDPHTERAIPLGEHLRRCLQGAAVTRDSG